MPFEIGRTHIIIGAAVLLVILAITLPLLGSVNQKSLRAEVPKNVNEIREAEITYNEAFEAFVSCEAAPRDPLQVDSIAVPWEPSSGFRKLSWSPEENEVRGSYTVAARGDDFTVTGVCDVDDDKNLARFEATVSDEAASKTDTSIF